MHKRPTQKNIRKAIIASYWDPAVDIPSLMDDEYQVNEFLNDIMQDNEILDVILKNSIDITDANDELYQYMEELYHSNSEKYSEEEYDLDEPENVGVSFSNVLKQDIKQKFLSNHNILKKESYNMENESGKSAKGSATAKVRKLQKQYNKILIDLFDQFAAESIEEALDQSEGSFGENICDIVQIALDTLKSKVLSELGVSDSSKTNTSITSLSVLDGSPAGDFLAGMREVASGEEDSETSKHESEESEEFEKGEQSAGDDDEEDDDKEDDSENDSVNESVVHFKEHRIHKSQLNDQASLSDIYSSIYNK